jgi:hypothetical protein
MSELPDLFATGLYAKNSDIICQEKGIYYRG